MPRSACICRRQYDGERAGSCAATASSNILFIMGDDILDAAQWDNKHYFVAVL